MSEQAQIDKGLKHLGGSEEIIGNIVAYCVNAHKADPSQKTMEKIRQYVQDTANSVCGHVLTIAHNINSIIDKESKEIEEMAFQVEYVQHRLQSHQTYMSQLYMTKFQTLPRPKKTIHILRETIPTDKLPKYARPKKPWVRHGVFDYSVLDHVGSDKPRSKAQTSSSGEGNSENIDSKTANKIAPKATVASFNPYERMMNNAPSSVNMEAPTMSSSTSTQSNLSAHTPTSPKGKSLYQQEKDKTALTKQLSSQNVGQAPPSFSAAPPSFSAAPPSFSAATSKEKQQPKPPKVPSAAIPPPVPAAAAQPPPVPPVPPQGAVPPPVPPVPPQD
eukprot:232087_1